MPKRRRWDRCIEHRGSEVGPFIAEYFGASERNVLLIAGAGFDPRSTFLCAQLASVVPALRGLLVQEERPNAAETLVARASSNTQQLTTLLPDYEVAAIDIFGTDNAVIGGRNVVNAVHRQELDGITDIVVDLSALSVGTSYPIVRYLVERIGGSNAQRNLHLFVSQNPGLDEAIIPIAGDTVGFVHGFKGGWALDASAAAAKLSAAAAGARSANRAPTNL